MTSRRGPRVILPGARGAPQSHPAERQIVKPTAAPKPAPITADSKREGTSQESHRPMKRYGALLAASGSITAKATPKISVRLPTSTQPLGRDLRTDDRV